GGPGARSLLLLRRWRGLLRQLVHLALLRLDEGRELLDLDREPAHARVPVVAAARDARSVASEERPVLRAPVVEPELALPRGRLAQALEGLARPRAALRRIARRVRGGPQSDLARERTRGDRMPSRSELQAVARERRSATSARAQLGEEVDDGDADVARTRSDGPGVDGKVAVS